MTSLFFSLFQGIVVDKEFDNVLKEIQSNRIFLVRYEAALPLTKGPVSQIDPKNIFNIDPIRILYFMKEHLRTIDLFLKFDKDCSNFLSRDEMKYAFEVGILRPCTCVFCLIVVCFDSLHSDQKIPCSQTTHDTMIKILLVVL